MTKRVGFLDRLDKRVHKIAGIISAILVILGSLTGVMTWVSNQFAEAVSHQIESFRVEVEKSDKSQNQAITRLELMNLIQNDPTNVAAIEKMARYYFRTLDGDLYMTSKYSEWARTYGGDVTIVIGE